MAGKEGYDYNTNPHMADFKDYIRKPSELHPAIPKREVAAAEILGRIDTMPIPDYASPQFIPTSADQHLELTPFDEFEGMRVEVPPREMVEAAEVLAKYNLRLANHPARIHARVELEDKGFKRSKAPDHAGVFETALNHRTVLQLSDLGHAVDLALNQDEQGMLERFGRDIEVVKALQSSGSKIPSDDARIESIKGAVAEVEAYAQTHRTELLASGPFAHYGRRVRSAIGTGANPDVMGSATMVEYAAKMGMVAEIPEIGKFSDPKVQEAFVKEVMSRFRADDPLLLALPEHMRAQQLEFWRSNICLVTEVDPKKANHRMELASKYGVSMIRPYGHTRGGDIIKTVRELRRNFPQSEIIASQITAIDTALACEYEGADALIAGVGSGGRCTTADLSQLIPTNAPLAWELRGKLGIPLIGEGGAIDNPIVSLLVGFNAFNGVGSIGAGTLEAPGGAFYLTNDGKKFVKPYGGEASPRMKHMSKRTFGTGIPYIPEGEQTMRALKVFNESMTQNVVEHWTRIVLGAVVMGIDLGPYTLQRMNEIGPDVLWQKSPTGSFMQSTH